ncbi:MAG: hypothetical protein V1897_08125 [Pseudomonadota bacterium]
MECTFPFLVVVLWIDAHIRDTLFNKGSQENFAFRIEYPPEFRQIFAYIIIHHVCENRIEVDDVKLSILKGEAKPVIQVFALWIVPQILNVKPNKLKSWMQRGDVVCTPSDGPSPHINPDVSRNLSNPPKNTNRETPNPTSHIQNATLWLESQMLNTSFRLFDGRGEKILIAQKVLAAKSNVFGQGSGRPDSGCCHGGPNPRHCEELAP